MWENGIKGEMHDEGSENKHEIFVIKRDQSLFKSKLELKFQAYLAKNVLYTGKFSVDGD